MSGWLRERRKLLKRLHRFLRSHPKAVQARFRLGGLGGHGHETAPGPTASQREAVGREIRPVRFEGLGSDGTASAQNDANVFGTFTVVSQRSFVIFQ
jgi:hypothetical protein